MKRKRSNSIIMFSMMLVCLISPLAAFSRTLNGVVISATDDEPLIGATVAVNGTKKQQL